jgi:DNA polymerase I-like protein with 3'-5' exonuclease and polymerase domains
LAPSYEKLTNLDELRNLAKNIMAEKKPFGFDVETGYDGESREKASLHREENFLVAYQFTNSMNWGRLVPLRFDTGENCDNYVVAEILWELHHATDDEGLPLGVAHGAIAELRWMSKWFLEYLGDHPVYGKAVRKAKGYFPLRSCTMLESFVVAESQHHDLKSRTENTFGHVMRKLDSLFPNGLTAKARRCIRFNVLDPDDPEVIAYGCEDAVWCLAHHLFRYPKVKDNLIYQVEMAVLPVIAEMQDNGVYYDWNLMREYSRKAHDFLELYRAEVLEDFEELAGEPIGDINFNSSKQFGDLLYEKCGIPVRHWTPKKKPKVDAKIALPDIAKKYPAVRKYLEMTRIDTLCTNFLDNYEAKHTYAEDGRAHPGLLQHGTVTGRFSCEDPNYQQCLPGSYEVLTPGGWVRLDALADGVPVAEYREDEVIRFTVPSQVVRDRYDGEMVELRSVEGGDWQYTPNHRIVYRKRRKARGRELADSSVREMAAEQWEKELSARPLMFPDGRRMLNDLKYIRAGYKTHGRELLPADLAALKLAVACQAEGNRRTDGPSGSVWYDVELRSERKQGRFAPLAQQFALDFRQTHRSRRCRVPGELVARWLNSDKNFRPDSVLELNYVGLRAFISAVMEWDGDFTRGDTYGQKSTRRRSVEVVQAAAVLCGYTTSLYERPEYGAVSANLCDKVAKYAGAQTVQRVPSPGTVYCVTVPSGMFLVRNLQGKVMVTGNSPKKYKYTLRDGTVFECNYRDVICAAPGSYILGFDYSQIELRVLAGEANETALLEAFASGRDVHSLTAALMLGMPLEKVSDADRSVGKTMNFALVYGMSEEGLADRLGITIEEAEDKFRQYFAAYPRIKQYMDQTRSQAEREGCVMTRFGRKVTIWELQSPSPRIRAAGRRTAGNAPIQGSATGDYVKISMIRAMNALREAGLTDRGVKLVMNIHDALEFEVPKDIPPAEVIRVLQPAILWKVPGWPEMQADWHLGERWGSVMDVTVSENFEVRLKDKKAGEKPAKVPVTVPGTLPDSERGRPALLSASPSPLPQLPATGSYALAHMNEIPRTVTVTTVHQPSRDEVAAFREFLNRVPGHHTVVLNVPGSGPVQVAGTYGLDPSLEPQVSIIFGGAGITYDLQPDDLSSLVSDMEL